MQKNDVNERIVGLERLNPTLRPTTSPFLEGRWNFEWIGYGSPGLLTARLLSERFPATLANLCKIDLVIKEGYRKITANMKFLNAVIYLKTITMSLYSWSARLFESEHVTFGYHQGWSVDFEGHVRKVKLTPYFKNYKNDMQTL